MTSRPKTGRRTWLWIALGGGGLILLLCGCIAVVALFLLLRGGTSSVTALVGPEGGEVESGGARLIVPAGAVDTPIEFQLRVAANPPAIPAEFLVSPAGRAFEIDIAADVQLREMAELQIPFEAQEGADLNLYTVFAWDDTGWSDVGGLVDGGMLRVQLDHFSVFQPANSYIPRRPVGFVNHGPYDAGVRPWSYVPLYSDTPVLPPNVSTTSFAPGAPGGWPNPSRFMTLPVGTYTFCVDYDREDTGEYWHFILGSPPIGVTVNDPTSLDLARQVDFSTDGGGHQRGRCPRPEGAPGAGGTPMPGTPLPRAGDVTLRLSWFTVDDLDLHVIEPSGEEIYYGRRLSGTGGQLDVDSNPGCNNLTQNPVENIYWPTEGAPRGQYTVRVHVYADCDDNPPVDFRLRIMSSGRVIYDGSGTLQGDQDSFTYTFSR